MNDAIQAVVYWIRLSEHDDITQHGYVGVTKNFDKRLQEHLYCINNETHPNIHLARAVKKYGWDNLIKEIIEYRDMTVDLSKDYNGESETWINKKRKEWFPVFNWLKT